MATRHAEMRRTPYTPRQMYDLVADVASYPQFLPWIAGTRVRNRRPLPGGLPGDERMEADMIVSFKVFKESYASLVELRPPEAHQPAQVLATAISGPFEKLTMDYRFHETPDGACDLQFEVNFAFRNGLLQRVAGGFFGEAMKRVIRGFEARAETLYGAKTAV